MLGPSKLRVTWRACDRRYRHHVVIMEGNLVLYQTTPSNPFHDYPLPIYSRLNLVEICILDQIWSPTKRKRKRNWGIRLDQIQILSHIIIIINNIQDISTNGGGDTLQIRPFSQLWRARDLDLDLGWPWKSYRCACLIDLYQYHILACGYIASDCGWTDGHFFTDSMSHLCSSAEMTNNIIE